MPSFRLTEAVECKIKKGIPGRFEPVLDGLKCGYTYVVEILACLCSKNKHGYELHLLTFSLMNDEDSLDAESHI